MPARWHLTALAGILTRHGWTRAPDAARADADHKMLARLAEDHRRYGTVLAQFMGDVVAHLAAVEEKSGTLGARLEAVERRLEAVEQRLEAAQQRLDGVHRDQAAVSGAMTRFKEDASVHLEALQVAYRALEDTSAGLTARVASAAETIAALGDALGDVEHSLTTVAATVTRRRLFPES